MGADLPWITPCLLKSDSQFKGGSLNFEKELAIFLLDGSERNSNTNNGLKE